MDFLFRSLIILTTFVISCYTAQSQIQAITSDGGEVVLYPDGTWKYADSTANDPNLAISVNPNIFIKPETSTFKLISKRTGTNLYLNSKVWKFEKQKPNEMIEYLITEKSGDAAYCMIISEKAEVPLSALRNIALANAKRASVDVAIVKEEYRMVNGQKVLCLQFTATVQQMKFMYYGYYHSSPKGTVQIISYTFLNLFEQKKAMLEELLNGFVIP
jgi:hypothetical protein